ncbi:Myb-like DNA-binding domain containing protein [Trichomonas vaginalis G3]|uniref:Myb-like DNA-binding domain containing protein n=1 Tax=Trichomonas vaginalis (strain ATCC PRA-98 / G3) TaxID=412133 RepID=A2E384_TRIV3|nr:RNA polymerase II transcription regulator recruiting protein [Trichomonas vaginalis G3]EAY12894.1 Myb-like DNA-binding domain containing protein [Trichomonas vaginalis G3]KAI5491937.1 RNA polymerase II transcription regulator recruiting protein [Trichomonas vaginalis G3]|eukprot:XP_001325117.1 Myb-like DNA-binding domain containing protein [Trichomonas vaginalis G3]
MDRLLPNGRAPREEGGLRTKFSEREDLKLLKLVSESGKSPNWREISNIMQTRTPRQCRERYQNYLCPRINHHEWTPEEDQILLHQYQIHGPKWNTIAKQLKGRTGNMIRNRWQSLLRQDQKKPTQDSVSVQTEEPVNEKKPTKADLAIEVASANPFDRLFQMIGNSIFDEESFMSALIGNDNS